MGSAEDSSKEINSGGAIMTIEKELSYTYLYIFESFHRLFDLIARFNIISAAEGLAKCNQYLENIQTDLQNHQNNKSVSQCLTMTEDALIRKQGYLKEFIKDINEKYSEQSSVAENDIRGQ